MNFKINWTWLRLTKWFKIILKYWNSWEIKQRFAYLNPPLLLSFLLPLLHCSTPLALLSLPEFSPCKKETLSLFFLSFFPPFCFSLSYSVNLVLAFYSGKSNVKCYLKSFDPMVSSNVIASGFLLHFQSLLWRFGFSSIIIFFDDHIKLSTLRLIQWTQILLFLDPN